MTGFESTSRRTTGARERRLVEGLRTGAIHGENLDEFSLSFFVKIQIQTVSYCNAACVTCPYPETSATQSMGRMEESLFHSIVEQIAGRGVERTSLFLMNEPLLDKRLESFTALVRASDPETKVTIITNGTLFDGARAEALADAGMGEVAVSVNGFDAATHARTMVGIEFDRIVNNLTEVGERHRRGDLGDMQVLVRGLDMGDARAQAAAFAERVGLPVSLYPVTNRAGAVELDGLASNAEPGGQPHPCQRPFVKAYILYDGRMVLCNCDWERSTIVGDLNQQSIEELWRGPVLDAVRRAHATGCVPEDSLCSGCDYRFLPMS